MIESFDTRCRLPASDKSTSMRVQVQYDKEVQKKNLKSIEGSFYILDCMSQEPITLNFGSALDVRVDRLKQHPI